jgi:hypothetical protein
MALSVFMTLRYLAALAATALLATSAYAQTAVPQTDQGKAVVTPYRSALDGYRAYTDEPVANWKAANDTVASIGGWREYAKQAQSEDATPARSVAPEATPAAKAKP